jgi:hypothetical protein
MNRNLCTFCFLVLALAALGGCSTQPSAKQSKKAAIPPQKIQGKAQVLEESGTGDASMNGGGRSSVYLWVGDLRYRLFLRTPVEVLHGEQYVAEGFYAQKIIDDIGDPDQGKNGYPLRSSCDRLVKMAWGDVAFDEADALTSTLITKVKRYPARPVFLVRRLRLATADEIAASAEPKKAAAGEKDVPEVEVAAEKENAFLINGPAVQTAPLWEPNANAVRCRVVIDQDGKISELATGAQLCESVAWSQVRYQPPVKAGHPVKVRTEVDVRFEPRK